MMHIFITRINIKYILGFFRRWKSAQYLTVFIVILSYSDVLAQTGGNSKAADMSYLKQRLQDDGIDADLIERYMGDPSFRIVPELLKINIKQSNGKLGYDRFIGTTSVKTAAKFLDRNRETMNRVLEGSRVDAEVVAAIFQVESGLGSYTGKESLLNIFASLTLLDNEQLEIAAPDFWRKTLAGAPKKDSVSARKKVMKKAEKKAKWAYKQLLAVFRMAEKGEIDPWAMGSWAGAYGLPQFIPTSIQAYGKDGNGDGKLDLNNLEDAVASAANYLGKHGYSPKSRNKRKKAIRAYNHSDAYVDCIMTLAHRIRYYER